MSRFLQSLLDNFRQLSALGQITTVLALISTLVGIIRFLYDCVRELRWVLEFFRLRYPKEGIYHGFWTLPNANRAICEVVRVRRTLRGFEMTRVFAPLKIGPYTLDAVRQRSNRHVFDAKWKKRGHTTYEGSAILSYHEDNSLLTGKWLGPDKFGIVRGGNWYLKHANVRTTVYRSVRLSTRLSPLLEAYEAIRARPSVLTNVIPNHENSRSDTITVKGIKLKITYGTFNPLCGVLSVPLLEEAERHVEKDMKVLDLGTGSGFHAIYLAKDKGCECTGVDISRELVELANFNSKENGTDALTSFRKCDDKDIFSWADWEQQYDIIIANLPFSTVQNTYRSRRSVYYKSFRGSRNLLTQVILGSLWYIKPGGKMFLCFGKSGYVRLLEYLIDVSPWESAQIWAHKGPLDETYISTLELRPDFKREIIKNFGNG